WGIMLNGMEWRSRPLHRFFPQAGMEKQRAWMVLVITGPLQASQLFKTLIAHAGVIGAEVTEFVPNALGRRRPPVMTQSTCEVGDNGQVVPRLTRWIEGFAHSLDATLAIGHRPLGFAPACRRRQHHKC